ncbi:YihY/virulence factor BrkB family protein [Nucisporomicrobium flavum]|uniref:YihY/virulence factor BrkB family protein n=1 Tax=Nucisporomicrobium flavum TaxID=2785915 RepID=UPI0027DE9BC1|nr:YihY/virulence factor BrkB family protein [Nucisporomicrobium flavum]
MRDHGAVSLLRQSALRFRYGDAFSHARALALLLCLAVVPLLIALTGLADEAGVDEGGQFVVRVTLELTPGRSDDLVRRLLSGTSGESGEVAQVLGLLTGAVAMTAATAQVERGANRIYGVQRDRPSVHKYVRALVLAIVAGVPTVAGFVMVVAGSAVDAALDQAYDWAVPVGILWRHLHLPLAVLLIVLGTTLLFRHAPRRRQPSPAGLMPGVLITTVLWFGLSSLLATYVGSGLSFSDIYGPLTAVMALLLWANATGTALFFGFACCAQLEACRRGDCAPCEPDRWGRV